MTNGSRGKPFANWALSGAAGEQTETAAALRRVDEQVAKGVNTKLMDMLA
jgi:hypothetical protein